MSGSGWLCQGQGYLFIRVMVHIQGNIQDSVINIQYSVFKSWLLSSSYLISSQYQVMVIIKSSQYQVSMGQGPYQVKVK